MYNSHFMTELLIQWYEKIIFDLGFNKQNFSFMIEIYDKNILRVDANV